MKAITTELIEQLISRAGESARRRTNYNVHEQPSDPVQRLFVAARLDSYFRPHRHPGKEEFALVLRGRFDVLEFDDSGRVTGRLTVGPGVDTIGFQMPADTWHAWIPMEDESVFFEVKQGPYDPQTAAEFAPWSPAEGTADVGRFVERLRAARVGDGVGG